MQKQPQTFERVENNQNGIDYSQYESGDDENLIFYNNQQRPAGALGNYSYVFTNFLINKKNVFINIDMYLFTFILFVFCTS